MAENKQAVNEGDAKAVEPDGVEYLEYKGDPQYGTEFLTSHTITPAQAKEAGWVTELPADLVWTRREGGRYKNRMLLPVKDLPAGVTEELEQDASYRVVTLKG